MKRHIITVKMILENQK